MEENEFKRFHARMGNLKSILRRRTGQTTLLCDIAKDNNVLIVFDTEDQAKAYAQDHGLSPEKVCSIDQVPNLPLDEDGAPALLMSHSAIKVLVEDYNLVYEKYLK